MIRDAVTRYFSVWKSTSNAVTGAVVTGIIMVAEIVTGYCSDWRNSGKII